MFNQHIKVLEEATGLKFTERADGSFQSAEPLTEKQAKTLLYLKDSKEIGAQAAYDALIGNDGKAFEDAVKAGKSIRLNFTPDEVSRATETLKDPFVKEAIHDALGTKDKAGVAVEIGGEPVKPGAGVVIGGERVELVKKAVEGGKTKPLEAAKAGSLVKGVTIETKGATVSHRKDGKEAEVVKSPRVEFVIKKNGDGKLVANLADNDKQHLVPAKGAATQEVTATLKVKGEAPKQVKFEVAKDGTLTEKPPAPTPKGQTQSTEPQR